MTEANVIGLRGFRVFTWPLALLLWQIYNDMQFFKAVWPRGEGGHLNICRYT